MSSISGAEAIVLTLREYGTEIVFGFIGHSTHEIANAVAESGIPTVNPATELGGAYMLTAYNYLKGRPAAVGIWHTVGSLLLPPALQEASSSRIPAVHIGLNADSRLTNRDGLQQVPAGAFAPVTRLTTRVERVDMIGDILHKAFQAAQGRPSGAVFVDIPFDITTDRGKVNIPSGWTLPSRAVPTAEDVAATVSAIRSAHRPVIIVGGGAVSSDAGPEIVRLAEMASIPVVGTTTAQGLVPETHPLALGTAGQAGWTSANDTLAEADLAIVLGSRLSDWGIAEGFTARLPKTLVQVDTDVQRLGEVYFPTVPVVADVREFVRAVNEALEHEDLEPLRAGRSKYIDVVTDRKKQWRDYIVEEGVDDRFPLNPWRVQAELAEVMDEDSILVSDIGNHTSWNLQGTVLTKPRRILLSFGEAVLGSGVPMGIGAKLAEPDTKVFVATGDGAVQYHLNELRVAAEHGLQIVIIVYNNDAYDANEQMMTSKFGRGAWTKFTNPDYVGIVKAYGGDGERITSAADLGPALKRGLASEGAYIIDVPIDVNVRLVDNHVSGPAFILPGRDIPADESGVRGAGAEASHE